MSKTHYQPQGEIARGGMGAVFHVVDAKLERSVAMKVMLRTRASAEEQWRFQQEARVLGQLAHPNIVPIHDLGTDEQGRPFYTMKLVQGITLQELITRLKSGDAETLARYPLRQLLAIFQKVCDGVAFAHSRGIIHRDLKPQNIMVGEYGEVLVMDWGLAKFLPSSPAAQAKCLPAEPASAAPTPSASELAPALSSEAAETLAAGESSGVFAPKLSFGQPTPPPSQASGSALTLEGRVMGTPHYMSPEQAEGRVTELDERTDIFALGGIFYALLTLRPPVDGASVEEMLAKARRGDITPPSALNARTGTVNTHHKPTGEVVRPTDLVPLSHMPGGRVPPGLSAVAMKALAPSPANRYPSVVTLSADINAFQGGFATSAENANALTLFRLFIHRHQAIAAAASILVLFTVGFMLKLVASEQLAKANAELAGTKSVEARKEAARATEAERLAIREREEGRRSLASARIALAEAAYRDQDTTMMMMSLRQVPEEMRSTTWEYLFAKMDSSTSTIPAISSTDIHCVVPHPTQPGVFAVADRHRKVTLFEAATGRQWGQFTINLETNRNPPFFQLAFTPDGERLAVVGSGLTNAALYRVADGTRLLTLPSPRAHRADFTRDGERLFLQSMSSASMVDVQTGREIWRTTNAGNLRKVLQADGRQIFATTYTNNHQIFSADDGRPLTPPTSTRRGITALAASPTENMVIEGFENGTVRAMLPEGFKLRFENRDPGWRIEFVAFTSDGRWFATLGTDAESGRHSLQLWDAQTGERIRSFLGSGGKARSLSIHPLTGEIAVGGDNSRIWKLPRYDERWRIPNSWLPVPQGVFWGSDDIMFTQTGRDPMKLKNMANGEVLWQAPDALFRAASVSSDQRYAFIGTPGGSGRSLLLTTPGRPKLETEVLHGKGSFALASLSPDGQRLAMVQNPRLVVRELQTGVENSFSVRNATTIRNIVWLSNRRLVVSASAGTPGSAGAVDYLVAREAGSTNDHYWAASPVPVQALAANPDGTEIAEAGQNNVIRFRDALRLGIRTAFRAHDRSITALAWHPRLPLLASGSADLSVKIWNVNTGKLVEEFIGPSSAPLELYFSPSGTRLACAAGDRTVHVWDLSSVALSAPVNTPANSQSASGWGDLLGRLDSAAVRLTGHGWTLNHGVLQSPAAGGATVALPGDFQGASYHLRLTVQMLRKDDGLAVLLPVGDRRAAYFFDGWPHRGVMSGFDTDRTGNVTAEQPGTVKGRQVTNSSPHTLEFVVRFTPPAVDIRVKLDGRDFAAWQGAVTNLTVSKDWHRQPKDRIGLGTHRGGWTVTEAKVKLLTDE